MLLHASQSLRAAYCLSDVARLTFHLVCITLLAYLLAYSKGPAAFDVNFPSLLIEFWSIVNSQIPLLTGQPSVDVELLQNNALSTPGWSVEGGI